MRDVFKYVKSETGASERVTIVEDFRHGPPTNA